MPAVDSPFNLLQQRFCPICGASGSSPVLTVKADPFYSEKFDVTEAQIVRCARCQSHFTNPVLRPEVTDALYLDGYSQSFPATAESLFWEDEIICYTILKEILNSDRHRVLDFGCGRGGFVYLCQKNGIDAWGIELNPTTVARASELGIKNLSAQPISRTPDQTYDTVASIHVFEHLMDCRAIVREFLRVLKPGGTVVIIVPSYDSFTLRGKTLSYWKNPYEHVNALTSRSLDRLFREFRFGRVIQPMSWFSADKRLSLKCRLSLTITKLFGNYVNYFPTKLICTYRAPSVSR